MSLLDCLEYNINDPELSLKSIILDSNFPMIPWLAKTLEFYNLDVIKGNFKVFCFKSLEFKRKLSHILLDISSNSL